MPLQHAGDTREKALPVTCFLKALEANFDEEGEKKKETRSDKSKKTTNLTTSIENLRHLMIIKFSIE